MKNLPLISIITPPWNSNLPLFERVLTEIKLQTYPKNLIEHIVMDAGSTNGTVELAIKYGCNVIVRSDLRIQELARAWVGIMKAKGELILILQSDNIITSKNWLKEMVLPFLENKKIVCTFSAYNSYEKDMNATTRYCALIGANDPTIYYLDKTEKIPMTQKYYNKGEILKETANYYIVRFNKNNLPTIGDNGHMFLKSAMEKVNKDQQKYVHPDAFFDMLELGYDTYGVVKNSIIHMITPNIKQFVKRRIQLKDTYYDGRRGKRKYLVFNWESSRDRYNLLKYIFSSLTFVYPLFESIRGYIKIRDTAWFLHPVICFLMVCAYSSSELRWQTKRFLKRF